MVWCCSLTGKPQLTYQEALQSEENARVLIKTFPKKVKYINRLPDLNFCDCFQFCVGGGLHVVIWHFLLLWNQYLMQNQYVWMEFMISVFTSEIEGNKKIWWTVTKWLLKTYNDCTEGTFSSILLNWSSWCCLIYCGS